MDTLLKFATILADANAIDRPRKFQTAMYLAQALSGCWLYNHHLIRGRVLSDELDQDLAQLESLGVICRWPDRVEIVERVPLPSTQTSNLLDGERKLSDAFLQLLNQDSDALEAAATLHFFAQEAGDHPRESLRWFKELPIDTLERAIALVSSLGGDIALVHNEAGNR